MSDTDLVTLKRENAHLINNPEEDEVIGLQSKTIDSNFDSGRDL